MTKFDILCIHIKGLKFEAKDYEEADEKAEKLIEKVNTILAAGSNIYFSGSKLPKLTIDDYEVEDD